MRPCPSTNKRPRPCQIDEARMSSGDSNPYQSPTSTQTARPEIVPDAEVWEDNGLLVLRKNAVLPDRCVKCNAPAEGFRLRRNLSWHQPAIYLTIFIGLL